MGALVCGRKHIAALRVLGDNLSRIELPNVADISIIGIAFRTSVPFDLNSTSKSKNVPDTSVPLANMT